MSRRSVAAFWSIFVMIVSSFTSAVSSFALAASSFVLAVLTPVWMLSSFVLTTVALAVNSALNAVRLACEARVETATSRLVLTSVLRALKFVISPLSDVCDARVETITSRFWITSAWWSSSSHALAML